MSKINMGNVRTKIRTYKEQGKDVLFSAIFITGKERNKLIDRATDDQLALITKNLKYENPERVRIELYDGKESPNTLWIKEFLMVEPVQEVKESGFKGFGEAEVNRLVDERFKERERLVEFEELKTRAEELAEENEELQDTITRLEQDNDNLTRELESKKQIRYYAGMLGDILESFGIAKDKIKNPLAGLMGVTDSEEKPKEITQHADQSGIVEKEESTEERKRGEIISLISEYLKTTSNQTLSEVFSIFSEIEQDKQTASRILEFLTTLKTKKDGNI